jgi:uncharacterized protein YcbK (DUF882 family)
MRISAAATLGTAADPSVPSSGLAAAAVVHSLVDVPAPAISLEQLGGAQVTFYNENTRETESFFLRFDGQLSAKDLRRITHLFRCKRTGHERAPARGLLQLLARLADQYPGHVINIVSAHRHNRGTSRTSKHWSAHAVDFRIQGVDVKDVRAFAWKMEEPIGLGYYREQQFLHIDYRPVDGKIAWDQRTESSTYHYWPAWSGGPPKGWKQAKKHKRQRPSRQKSLRSAQPNA